MRDEWCGRFEFELCFGIGEPRRGLFIASSINLGQEHEDLVSIAQFQKQGKKQGLEQDYRAGGIVGMIIMFAQWIVYLVFWNLCFLSVQVVAWLWLVCFDLDCSGIHRKIDRALHLRLSPSCFLPKHSIHRSRFQTSNSLHHSTLFLEQARLGHGRSLFLVFLRLMLMPNAAFCTGLQTLAKFEAARVGVQWDNVFMEVFRLNRSCCLRTWFEWPKRPRVFKGFHCEQRV